MTPRDLKRTAKMLLPAIMLLLIIAGATTAATTQPQATLIATQTQGTINVTLHTTQQHKSAPITITLRDQDAAIYVLPATQTEPGTWNAVFPMNVREANLSAQQSGKNIARTTIKATTKTPPDTIITVEDVIGLNISVDTTGLSTEMTITNSSGEAVGTGTTGFAGTLLSGKLYDLSFTTTLTSGRLTATLHDVNLSKDLNITSDITQTYDGTLPVLISKVSPIYAIDLQGANFTSAELSIPKAGNTIEHILHCTDWDYQSQGCNAWEVNDTADYDYAENATHFTINVSGFDAFGGGPGDTLPNLTQIRLYDVTDAASNRTGGQLVANGTNTTFTLGTNRLYRAELNITNEGLLWNIEGADKAAHAGLNTSWSILPSDIWYEVAGANHTGGTFTGGTVSWNLSSGGTMDAGASGTWYYVFNTTSLPAKDYQVSFTINDTSTSSGSTDQSTYRHVYEREIVVNQSSLSFSKQSPMEGENVTITMTIYNIGRQNATGLAVELWDLTTSTLLSNTTIDISAEDHTTITHDWSAATGAHLMEVRADTPLEQNGTIIETYEDNNNYSATITTSAWQVLYGNLFEQTVLQGGTQDFHAWPRSDLLRGANIYAADADANIDWSSVQALTRNVAGNPASQDLAQADQALGMEGYPDSITARYGLDNSTPRTTGSFTVYGKGLSNVPLINSTTTQSFTTGMLWDSADDTGDGEYDGTETLIFLTKTSPDTLGTYGTYDYELAIPSALQATEGASHSTYLYVEIS